MDNNDEVLEKACDILRDHRVDMLILAIVNGWFEPTPTVSYSGKVGAAGRQEITKGATIKSDGHELIVGFTKFENRFWDEDGSRDGEALIYFDGDLVLRTSADEYPDEYGGSVSVSIRPAALKAFKAGPWLKLLGQCHQVLDEAHKQRLEKKRNAEVADRASSIDLGDYD